jgi:TolB-like protein
MTSSTSSSSRLAAFGAALLLAGPAASSDRPAGEGGGEGRRLKLAVFPLENLSGRPMAPRAYVTQIETALAMRGVDVVSGDQLEGFFAKHRIRYTGGLERATAKAARDDLGVDGIVLGSLQLYQEAPPRLGLSLRLVSSGEDATILWMGGVSRAGDERPGLLGLGIVDTLPPLEAEVISRLADALARHLSEGGAPALPCDAGGWFQPRMVFQTPVDLRERRSLLVLPFVNRSNRRNAGEIVSQEFTRQLLAAPQFLVTEPGVVRQQLLQNRVVMEDGVDLDQARVLMGVLEADYVMAGYVFEYDDGNPPASNFTAMMIERRSGRIVWESTSFNRGDDSVTVFEMNKVGTAPALTCRMIRNVVEELVGLVKVPAAARP